MNDFSSLNHLPAEVKLLLVNGQALVDEAKEKMKDRTYYFDMTSKMQLKSDCKEVERYIKLISKGKLNEKNKSLLEVSITRLHTTLDGLVEFYTR